MAAPTAFYAGSFDPITNGHLDVLKGALAVADRVVVAIGVHPGKKPLFELAERIDLIDRSVRGAFEENARRIETVSFDDLTVTAARRHGASVILRGIRSGTDLDYEMQMAGMNAAMEPGLTTVFLPAGAEVRMITATLVRQIASMGGDVRPFVPPLVAAALKAKFAVPA